MRKSAIGRRGAAMACSGNEGTPRRPRINGRPSRLSTSRRKAGRSVGISDGPAAKQWLSPSTVAVTRTRCRVRPPAIQPGSVSVRLLTTKCNGACSKRVRAASASSSAFANSRTHWLPGTLVDAAGFSDSIGIPILRGASALVNTNGARSRRNSGTLKRTCIARAARSAAADRSAAPDISVKLVAGSQGTARNCSVTPDGRMDSYRPRFVRRRLAPSSIIAAFSPGSVPSRNRTVISDVRRGTVGSSPTASLYPSTAAAKLIFSINAPSAINCTRSGPSSGSS